MLRFWRENLSVAKAGFHWHFENREALLDALLEFWAHEYSEVTSLNPLIRDQPADKRLLFRFRSEREARQFREMRGKLLLSPES